MKPQLILGVDPGLSGALALLNPVTGEIPAIIDTPTLLIKRGSSRRKVDLFMLNSFLDAYHKDILFSVIEEVHSMPNQGVTSTFTFGKAFGIAVGMIASYNLPIYFTPPAVWKGSMDLSSNKLDSVIKASKLFPNHTHLWGKKDGRAEALLLAYFGKRLLGGNKS